VSLRWLASVIACCLQRVCSLTVCPQEAGKHTRNRPGQIRATRSQGRPCLSTKLHHARMANWGVDGVHGAELSDTIYKISE
jgi:hypothetical protein